MSLMWTKRASCVLNYNYGIFDNFFHTRQRNFLIVVSILPSDCSCLCLQQVPHVIELK